MNQKIRHHAVEVRRDAKVAMVSPHLLDLGPTPEQKKVRQKKEERRPRFRIFRLLDEHIHLRDLRARSLSVHPRGWRDFPPRNATTMAQAVRITIDRFFREHPLADLTLLTMAHLFVVLLWNMFLAPGRLAEKLLTAPRRVPKKKTLPVMPFMAVPAAASPSARRQAQGAKLRVAWQPPGGWQKSMIGFAAACLVLMLPLGVASSLASLRDQKTDLMNLSLDAVRLLKDAGSAARSRDFVAAGRAFDEAETRFTSARDQLGVIGKMLSSAASLLPVSTAVSAAGPVLVAGRELSAGGSIIADGFTAVDGTKDPVAKIEALRSHFSASLPHLSAASVALGKISPKSVPAEYRDTIETAQRDLPKLAETIGKATAVAGVLPSILGAHGTRRYLVVFQNNAELRPTGGFIGSFALLDVKDGKLTNVEIPGGGSYDLKGGLRAKIVSPQPLHLINPHWQFQDANWSPDFPTSAKMLRWFYEKSGGPTTDGVIAITATLMERLLEVTGPVEMPEYGKTIDAGNFYFETQKEVELDYDKAENKPKKFIGDLAPKVLSRLLDADQATYVKLIAVLDKAMQEKHLLMWFTDEEAQSKIAEFGWDGAMKQTDGDYLALIHTNIGGQKTDLVMKDEVEHDVKILADGGAIVTLTLKRSHTGTKGALFSGVRNVDYLRVYVPQGSTLVEARGFQAPDPKLFKFAAEGYSADPTVASQEDNAKIDRASGTRISLDAGKTVFGNWIQTDPGETDVITLVYRLPPDTVKTPLRDEGRMAGLYQKLVGEEGRRFSYSLLVQKQPGAAAASFTSRIDAPRGFDLSWQSEDRLTDDRGRWTASKPLSGDIFTGILLEGR